MRPQGLPQVGLVAKEGLEPVGLAHHIHLPTTSLLAADLFDILLPMLNIYQEFVRNHQYSLQILAHCKQNRDFDKLLKHYEAKPDCEERTLETFLTYPMFQVTAAARINPRDATTGSEGWAGWCKLELQSRQSLGEDGVRLDPPWSHTTQGHSQVPAGLVGAVGCLMGEAAGFLVTPCF